MEKWSQSFQKRISKLEEKIGSLLELEPQNQNEQENSKSLFEPIHDSKIISTLSRELPENFEDKTIILFSRLSMFFEVGILFEKEKSFWKAQAYFERGRLVGLTQEKLNVRGGPDINPLQIVKAPALPFLKQLKLDGKIEKSEDLTAFLLRPHEDVSFVLMTRLVGPWLKMHMDQNHQEVLKAFT